MPVAAALKVLIVDDDMSMRMIVRCGLHQLGFRDMNDAPDGQAAVQSASAVPPDLVISDLNMPKMDGLGLLQALRAYPPTARSTFIMLTGRSDKEVLDQVIRRGADHLLVKPFTIGTLRGGIEAVLGPLT